MRKVRKSLRYANCRCDCDITRTMQGLALTPSQMDAMRLQGLPVSSGVLSKEYFDDGKGDVKASDLLFQDKRGIDINEAWNEEKDLKEKVKKGYTAFRKDKQKIESEV